MRIWDSADTPIGLAILLGTLTWLSAQLVDSVQDTVLLSYQFTPMQLSDGKPGVEFDLTNESVKRALVNGSVALNCPVKVPSCFRQSSDGTFFFDPQSTEWDIRSSKHPDTGAISIDQFTLPAGGTLSLQLGLTEAGAIPSFRYTVPSAMVSGWGTDLSQANLLVAKRQFWTGWPHQLIFIMVTAWIVLALATLAWLARIGPSRSGASA